jgi:hypothetical protein
MSLLIAFLGTEVNSQMPQTDVFLLNYKLVDKGLELGETVRISENKGYNNQPSFSKDCSSILYTSNKRDTSNTDIYQYDIANGKSKNIISGELSDYSPIFFNNHSVSYVRVEDDKKQKLHLLDLKSNKDTVLCNSSDSIGYYTWTGDNTLGLIVLDNGLELHSYKLSEDSTRIISKPVGRFIAAQKDSGRLFFLQRNDSINFITCIDLRTMNSIHQYPALNGCEDYAIDKYNGLYGGKDGILYRYDSTFVDHWRPILNLKNIVGTFYRMSFCKCGSHLCVVAFSGKKP